MIDENVNKIKDIVIIMIKSNVFNIRNGKAELNFDKDGDLMNIKVEQQLYKKINQQHDKKIQTNN